MQTVGYAIRQLRRERNLTQTLLGGEHFSKSYISAVERSKIKASSEALKHFAEQLGQPSDYFLLLEKEFEEDRQVTQESEAGPVLYTSSQDVPREELALLDVLLQHAEYTELPAGQDWLNVAQETLTQFPLAKQGRYYFLLGLMRQKNGQYIEAISAFEMALALLTDKHRPAIFDELGMCHYFLHAFQTAFGYHLRALEVLREQEAANGELDGLSFQIELHCGNACLASADYRQAYTHYERARSSLKARHDMKSAGMLYHGLGYCAYALAFQAALQLSNESKPDVVDQQYQHAISYLLQSRSIYQVSGDRREEARVRLTLVMVLLDLCNFRRAISPKEREKNNADAPSPKLPSARIASLLDDAAQECRQVMMHCQGANSVLEVATLERMTSAAIALAGLVRVTLMRAALAREEGHWETMRRERAVAAYLCQQVLDALEEGTFPAHLVQRIENLPLPQDPIALQFSSLPSLPDLSQQNTTVWCTPVGQCEIYLAAAEVAEESGRSTTSSDFASNCYRLADRCMRVALDLVERYRPLQYQDPGYLVRAFQRCIDLLKERLLHYQDARDQEQDITDFQNFLNILGRGLLAAQSLFAPTAR